MPSSDSSASSAAEIDLESIDVAEKPKQGDDGGAAAADPKRKKKKGGDKKEDHGANDQKGDDKEEKGSSPSAKDTSPSTKDTKTEAGSDDDGGSDSADGDSSGDGAKPSSAPTSPDQSASKKRRGHRGGTQKRRKKKKEKEPKERPWFPDSDDDDPDIEEILQVQAKLPMRPTFANIFKFCSDGNMSALMGTVEEVLRACCQTQTDERSRSPLLVCCQDHPPNAVDVAQVLLERGGAGSTMNSTFDSLGRTSLHWACYHGDVQLARLLLRNGADGKHHDNSFATPLHLILARDQIRDEVSHVEEIVAMLMESGADASLLMHLDGFGYEEYEGDSCHFEQSRNCVQLLVQHLITSIEFERNKINVKRVDEARMHGASAALAVLLGQKEVAKTEVKVEKDTAVDKGKKLKKKVVADDANDGDGGDEKADPDLGDGEANAGKEGSSDGDDDTTIANSDAKIGVDEAFSISSFSFFHPRVHNIVRSPLGHLIRLVIILKRARQLSQSQLIPRPDEEAALKTISRAARMLMDAGADLILHPFEAKLEEEDDADEDDADGEQKRDYELVGGSILRAIVRNELELLVMHHRVQSALNDRWYNFDQEYYDNLPDQEDQAWEELYDPNSSFKKLKTKFSETFNMRAFKSDRFSFFCSSMFFLFWILLVTVSLVRQYSGPIGGQSFFMAEELRERYVGDELGYDDNKFPVTFTEIANQDEVQSWLQSPFGESALGDFNFDATVEPARVRLFRYKYKAVTRKDNLTDGELQDSKSASQGDAKCILAEFPAAMKNDILPPLADQPNAFMKCADPFNWLEAFDEDDEDALGVAWENVKPEKGSFAGRLGTAYPNVGGFTVVLDKNAATVIEGTGTCSGLNASATLSCLTGNSWVDQSSAAVIAEVPIYNPSVGQSATVRMVCEFPLAGKTVCWSQVDMVTFPYPLAQPATAVTIVVEFLAVAIWLFNSYREAKQVLTDKLLYFKDKWNFNDIAGLVLIFVLIVLRVIGVVVVKSPGDEAPTFTQLQTAASIQRVERMIASILLISLWFGMLKFLRVRPQIGILLRIIKQEINDVVVFLVTYMGLLLGFGFAFHILLGSDMPDFRTIWFSILRIGVMTTGDFDFAAVQEANRWFALLLFLVFVVASVVLLLNLLIAMLSQSYTNVYESAQQEYLCERAKVMGSYDDSEVDPEHFDNYRKKRGHSFREMEARQSVQRTTTHNDWFTGQKLQQPATKGPNGKPMSRLDLLQAAGAGKYQHFPVPLRTERDPEFFDVQHGVLHSIGVDSVTVKCSPLTKGEPDGFIRNLLEEDFLRQFPKGKHSSEDRREAAMWVHENEGEDIQPRTANVPNAFVVVDIGEDRRLCPSGYRLSNYTPDYYEHRFGEWFPRTFVVQATNDVEAATEHEKGLPVTPVDARWVTLNNHVKDTELDAWNDTVIVRTMWHTRTQQMAGFRFFRLVMSGRNSLRAFQEDLASNLEMRVNPHEDPALFRARWRAETRSRVLSFCGFELYGALFRDVSEEFREKYDFFDGAAATRGDSSVGPEKQMLGLEGIASELGVERGLSIPVFDSDDVRALAVKSIARQDQMRLWEDEHQRKRNRFRDKLSDDNRWLLKAIKLDTSADLDSLRSILDQRIRQLAIKLRSMEGSVHYVKSHMEMSDYEFVFDTVE